MADKKQYSVVNPFKSTGKLADLLVGEEEGFEEKITPADTKLTQLSEGNIPITEAEANIRKIRKNFGVQKDRILGGFWDSVKGRSGELWDVVKYRGDIPDEVLRERAQQANTELEALNAEKNRAEMQEAILANRRPIQDVRAEMAQMISAFEDRQERNPGVINANDFRNVLDDYLQKENYTWRELQGGPDVETNLMPDPFDLETSSPDPFPEGRITGEIAGSVSGYLAGHGLAAGKFGKGFKKGFMLGRGPFWWRVGAGAVGGMIGVGAAEYGYELALDTMNQAGMFGKEGINRPSQKERIRQSADIAEIDAKLTATTAAFIPAIQSIRNLTRSALFGFKGKPPGMAGAIQGEKLMEKFTGIKYDPILDITSVTPVGGVAALPFTLGKFPIITGGIKGNMVDRAEKLNMILTSLVDRVGPSIAHSKLSDLAVRSARTTAVKYQGRLRELFENYWKKGNSFDAEVVIGGHPGGEDVKGLAEMIMRRYESGLGIATDGSLLPTFKTKPLYNWLKDKFARYPDTLTPNQIDQILRVDFADIAKAVGDDGFAIKALEDLTGGMQASLAKMQVVAGPGKTAELAAAQTKELMLSKKAFDDFWGQGKMLFNSDVAKGFSIKGIDKYGYQVKLMEVGPKYADQLLDTAKYLQSPKAMENFRNLVGDDIFRASIRRHIETAWMKSLKPFEGKTQVESWLSKFFLGDPEELMKVGRSGTSAIGGATEAGARFIKKGEGINHYVDPDKFLRNLGLLRPDDPGTMETMKMVFDQLGQEGYKPLSKLPSWAANGADDLIDAGADYATVTKVFENGRTTTKVMDKLPTTKDFIDFAQVMSAAFKGGVPDVSTFIARRAQISGLRGIIGAFLPGAGGGAGAVVSPGLLKVVALAVMGRAGMKVFTNPINMKAFHKVLDPKVPLTSKAWQTAAMIIGQNFRTELEDLDLTLAGLELKQRQKEQQDSRNAVIENKTENLKGNTATTFQKAKDKINEAIQNQQLQERIFKNLKPESAIGDQSALPSPTVQPTDVANVGGSPVAGSSLFGSNEINPAAGAALYAGDTDMALANQYGGGAFGPPQGGVQQMPRMAAKGGIISLVS
tara:strand:+ start:3831 stop:7088 length:3258 start_codon:yes stop_codon:yes gene_type:complete